MKAIQHIKNGVSNENIEYFDTNRNIEDGEIIKILFKAWREEMQKAINYDIELTKLQKENEMLKKQIDEEKQNRAGKRK